MLKGWVSNKLFDNQIIGWLLDTDNELHRTAIIRFSTYSYEVLCDSIRSNPTKYPLYKNYGFRLTLSDEIISSLCEGESITLIDKLTGKVISKTKISPNFNNQKELDVLTTKTPIIGKLGTFFRDLKITGWICKKNSEERRTAIVKINESIFESIANIYREDLKEKGISDGYSSFEIHLPFIVVSTFPEKFEVQLVDKETGILVDRITYRNVPIFQPQNTQEYLNYSMVNPIVYAPFTENFKRCFAFMENVALYLSKHSSNSLCSVIMPVFNRQSCVVDAINSVLNQEYENFELIIIDDASSDDTVKIIKTIKDSRITLIENKENRGCSYSRNVGLNKAKGKYVFYLDSDNTWDGRYLKVMVGAFEKISDADAIYCGQYLFEGEQQRCYAIRFASFNKSLLENRNYIDLNCFGHKKSVTNELNGFDESLKRLVDYDLILRISNRYTIYSIPVLLSNYYFDKARNTITKVEKIPKYLTSTQIIEKDNIKIERKHCVSAIIPSYETIEDIEECISSLKNNNVEEIIVIDNASSTETIRRLEILKNKGIIKLILNAENLGFTYAVNQGIKLANVNNDILLVNNDSVYEKNSVSILSNAAYELDNVGLVVPRQVLYANNSTITAHVPYADPSKNCDVNLSIHHHNIENVPLFSKGDPIELNFAPFFSVYIKRDILDKVGLLDAEHGRHYRSDRIFCDLVTKIYNKKCWYIPNAIVYHKLQQSTKEIKKKSSEAFELMYKANEWDKKHTVLFNFNKKFWSN